MACLLYLGLYMHLSAKSLVMAVNVLCNVCKLIIIDQRGIFFSLFHFLCRVWKGNTMRRQWSS